MAGEPNIRAIRLTDETWRKLYAGLAMGGCIASTPAGADWPMSDDRSGLNLMERYCVKKADALLAELKRTEAAETAPRRGGLEPTDGDGR